MNTYPVSIQPEQHLPIGTGERHISAIMLCRRETPALLAAVMSATALVAVFVWVASIASNDVISGGTWGLGLIFFGLATDSRKRAAIWQLTTGVALLVLAFLQVAVSPDFTLVSGAIVTTWVAVTVFRRLQIQR
jgi:hypothetical protein